ncbi:hypothetical protein ACWEQL_29425 [Kitasatospora sp. NPDC004240]
MLRAAQPDHRSGPRGRNARDHREEETIMEQNLGVIIVNPK